MQIYKYIHTQIVGMLHECLRVPLQIICHCFNPTFCTCIWMYFYYSYLFIIILFLYLYFYLLFIIRAATSLPKLCESSVWLRSPSAGRFWPQRPQERQTQTAGRQGGWWTHPWGSFPAQQEFHSSMILWGEDINPPGVWSSAASTWCCCCLAYRAHRTPEPGKMSRAAWGTDDRGFGWAFQIFPHLEESL